MPRKFFSLKNMLKIDTFLLVANFFSGKIYRGSFTNQNGFSALLKKITEIRNFWIGCMNYIYGKTFFSFYENFEFLSSRPLFLGKFDFFWKNQKTTFLLKKIFFSSMRWSRGIRRCPRWRIFFPPTHWLGIYEEADPCQFGLKKFFLLNKPLWPSLRSENTVDVSKVIF